MNNLKYDYAFSISCFALQNICLQWKLKCEKCETAFVTEDILNTLLSMHEKPVFGHLNQATQLL